MYDPSIGRWLSEDPIGFKAGDADLYRYVANCPTDAIDPSGLDADFVSKKQLNFTVPGFTFEEWFALMIDMRFAVERLDKALSMLIDHWDELEPLSKTELPGGKTFVSERYRKLASKHSVSYNIGGGGWATSAVIETTIKEEYIKMIKSVLDPLRDPSHRTEFKPDRSSSTPNGRMAYVVYTLGIPGSTIHITNLFFTRPRDEQIDVIVHELGRRIGFGEENTGKLLKDVYEWDRTIDFLANRYDEMMRKKR